MTDAVIAWDEGVPRAAWTRFARRRARRPPTTTRPPLTPEQRRLRARLAAQARWARPGAREAQSAKISEVRLAAHERRVDPDGVMEPRERRRLAQASLEAEMTALAFRSSTARSRRRARD